MSLAQSRGRDIRFAEYVTQRGIRPESVTEELHRNYTEEGISSPSIAELTANNISSENVGAANYGEAYNQRVDVLHRIGQQVPATYINIPLGVRGPRASPYVRATRNFIAQADQLLSRYCQDVESAVPVIFAAIAGPGRTVFAGEYSSTARLVFGATRSIIERDDARQLARETATREAVEGYRQSVLAFLDDPHINWHEVSLSRSGERAAIERGTVIFFGALRRSDAIHACEGRALDRLARGEGYAESPEEIDSGDGISIRNPISRAEFNSERMRYQRLRQAELRQEGLGDTELHDLVPFFGPVINFMAGDPNALTHLGIDAALLEGPSLLRVGTTAVRNALGIGAYRIAEGVAEESRLIANMLPANDLFPPLTRDSARMVVGAEDIASFQRELDAARATLEAERFGARSNPFDALMMSGGRGRETENLHSTIIEEVISRNTSLVERGTPLPLSSSSEIIHLHNLSRNYLLEGEELVLRLHNAGIPEEIIAKIKVRSMETAFSDAGNPRIMAFAEQINSKPIPAGRIDCSKRLLGVDRNGKEWFLETFFDDLRNFEPGASLHNGLLTEDLCLVSYYDSSSIRRTRNWWTHIEVRNRMRTMDDVKQHLALPLDWGARNALDIILIPAGTDVTFISGSALEQFSRSSGEFFVGRGFQVRLRDYDPLWMLYTVNLGGI